MDVAGALQPVGLEVACGRGRPDPVKAPGTPEFLRAEMIDASPMIWFIEVNGLSFDARELPVEIQVEAYLKGIIPYIPDLGRDATAAMMSARS